MTTTTTTTSSSNAAAVAMVEEFCRKRVRRGESFGRMGVDRTISNSLKSPSRRKQKQQLNNNNQEEEEEDQTNNKLSVRFAEETPMIYHCSHYEPNMTPIEMEQRKKELFYSRHDFEGFLQERISTIRLLRAVHGDEIALRKHCPDLCLRGLEPYQCDTMNQELQCQRLMHLRVVLTEQTLARNNHNNNNNNTTTTTTTIASSSRGDGEKKQPPSTPVADPEVIRQLAEGRSEYARKRARQLGSMDEMEVKSILQQQLGSGGGYNDPRTALMNRRRSLQIASAQRGLENLMLTTQRQASLSNLVGLSTPAPRAVTTTNTAPLGTAAAAARRVPVDLAILKEWNAKFLQDIRLKNGQTQATTAHPNILNNSKSLSDKTAESRRALQRDSLLFRKALGLAATTTTTTTPIGTTTTTTAPIGNSNELARDLLSIKSRTAAATSTTTNATPAHHHHHPSFRFPVRRDSLVGLRRESFLASKQQVQAAAAAVLQEAAKTPATTTVAVLPSAPASDVVAPASSSSSSSPSSSTTSSSHQHEALGTLAAAAAAVSAATTGSGVSVAEACFRFPVRRDSLSNVHWN